MTALTYGSVCSGIEAATVAWHPLGWRAAFYSEIDKFPAAVLAHHYPAVPNHGDLNGFRAWPEEKIDVLVGGTPCQSFSVAGLRAGLADPRGSLMLTFLALADRLKPRWLVWENVPGVLSSNGGRDFGSFLGALGQLGYGFAYRVLDAQHFGVPQRRRRVFVVGHLGDWRRAAAVLFERHSLQGNPAPRREAGKGTAACTAPSLTASGRGVERTGESRGQDPVVVHAPELARCVATREGSSQDWETTTRVAHSLRAEHDASGDGTGRGTPLVPTYTLAIRGRGESHDLEYRTDGTANAILTPNGGRGGIGVGAIAFDTTQITSKANYSNPKAGDPCHPLAAGAHPPAIAFSSKDHGADAGETAPTLRAMGHAGSHANAGGQVAVAFHHNAQAAQLPTAERDTCISDSLTASQQAAVALVQGGSQQDQFVPPSEVAPTLAHSSATHGGHHQPKLWDRMQVRRLTPRECERLQGFPDDYTLIPYRNKPAADGPRYKALGNSMAVPVMRWIGERIAMQDMLL